MVMDDPDTSVTPSLNLCQAIKSIVCGLQNGRAIHLIPNGLHLNILLFLFKLAPDASFLSLKFKRIFYLERGNKEAVCMHINQRQFWNKVYRHRS